MMPNRVCWMWLCAAVLLAAACATVPITGRTQLSLISDQQLLTGSDQAFAQFIQMARQKNAVVSRSESPQVGA
ncbi:MAG: hypothetical protein ACREMY_10440, partial [bacterium]